MTNTASGENEGAETRHFLKCHTQNLSHNGFEMARLLAAPSKARKDEGFSPEKCRSTTQLLLIDLA